MPTGPTRFFSLCVDERTDWCDSPFAGRVPKWPKGTDCKSVIRGFDSHRDLSKRPASAGRCRSGSSFRVVVQCCRASAEQRRTRRGCRPSGGLGWRSRGRRNGGPARRCRSRGCRRSSSGRDRRWFRRGNRSLRRAVATRRRTKSWRLGCPDRRARFVLGRRRTKSWRLGCLDRRARFVLGWGRTESWWLGCSDRIARHPLARHLARHSVGARRNLRSRLILARRRAWLWALWTDRIARVLLARNGARLRLLRTDRITRVLLARSGTRSGLLRVARGSCGGSTAIFPPAAA